MFFCDFLKIFLAVGQGHLAPVKHADLITSPADLQGFPLRVDAVALVDVVDTAGEPDPAVAAVGLNRVNGLAIRAALDAFGGDLPAGLVGDGLAVLESEAVILGQLANRANVDHLWIPFRIF